MTDIQEVGPLGPLFCSAFYSYRELKMDNKQSAWRNPWVIAWVSILIGFFIISGTRIYFALTTSPGLVVDDYYERGQDYEENILKRRARDPGWKMKVLAPKYVDIAKPTLFGFSVTDKEGNPIISISRCLCNRLNLVDIRQRSLFHCWESGKFWSVSKTVRMSTINPTVLVQVSNKAGITLKMY